MMGVNARRPAAPRVRTRTSATGGSRTANSTASARRPAAGSRKRAASRPGHSPARPATPRRTAGTATAQVADGEEAPRQITVRTLVLFLVVLVAFIVLAPTLRAYVGQQEEQRDLVAQIEAAEERGVELQRTIDRWEDPAFVQAQARERLGFVMPGETPYRVVDPETVTGEEVETDLEDGLVAVPQVGPWYLTVADSIQVAGEVSP